MVGRFGEIAEMDELASKAIWVRIVGDIEPNFRDTSNPFGRKVNLFADVGGQLTTLVRRYSFFSTTSFSTLCSRRRFSSSSSRKHRKSEASMPPYLAFHLFSCSC